MNTAQNSQIPQSSYIQALAASTARNAYGLPEGIYRADLLPALPTIRPKPTFQEPKPTTLDSNGNPDNSTYQPIAIFDGGKYTHVAKVVGLPRDSLKAFEEEINSSFVPLDYSEGFPTINARPFWCQLDFEPPDAYLNFESYLRQAHLKPAKLKEREADDEQPDSNDPFKGVRQLHLLDCAATIQDLQQQSILYYWADRSRAFDTFNVVMRRRERERQALSVENQHLLMGNRLMSIAEAFLDANAEELSETLTPKNFLELLKVASQLQRISVGLPMNGPSGASQEHNPAAGPQSVEVILRQIAAANTVPQDAAGGPTQDREDQQNALQSLLSDPEALNLAQELIVRVTKP